MKAATKQKVSDSIDTCRLLSVEEAVQLLKVGRTTLFGLVARKKNPIPSVRIGKSRRFPFDKVRWWMDNLEQ